MAATSIDNGAVSLYSWGGSGMLGIVVHFFAFCIVFSFPVGSITRNGQSRLRVLLETLLEKGEPTHVEPVIYNFHC